MRFLSLTFRMALLCWTLDAALAVGGTYGRGGGRTILDYADKCRRIDIENPLKEVIEWNDMREL